MKRNKEKRQELSDLNKQEHMQAESIHEEPSADDQALIAQLLHGFDQMERAIRQPEPPALHELEMLVASEQRKLRKHVGMEVALFLVIALALICGNILLASMNLIVFIAIQALVFVGVITFAVRFFYRSRKKVKSGHA
ncbi:YxlC family protein [Paenibacillus chibensis]|uniref:YxlC family protein n=1 Tax=Paenibacillus chibensis TaxID=59846 RepID=A0ABU6PMH0_9BACL|nr:YxlC family protein [Paenibacillus chibensis]